MRYISFFATFLVSLLIVFPTHADVEFNDEVRKEVVGLFGTLLAPTPFTTASSEKLSVSVYGRTLTAEGKVPDFDGSLEDEIDELTIFVSGRMGGLGLTLGFSQGSDFEFSSPVILALDYKAGLLEKAPMVDAAVDVQYSMIILPDEENINVSALGFGVLSVSALVSADLLFLLEPYAGLTLNYVYLNSEEDFIGVTKLVPKIGLQVKPFPLIKIGTELKFINNEHLESSWMWDIGASVRF